MISFVVPVKVEPEETQQKAKELVETLTMQLKEKDEKIDHLNQCLKGNWY